MLNRQVYDFFTYLPNQTKVKNSISLLLKGFAMGAANVIPGVSGGTIALITGIFERLINAIKSFNGKAASLLFSGKFKEFSRHTDLPFLIAVFAGIALSIISLARLLGYLFEHHPVFVWAYFFGLILASVWFVGRDVKKWNWTVIVAFVTGALIAFGISLFKPAAENENFFYLIICGVVAICSMILPGLSGSFVLILLGNYQLVVIEAVNELRLDILLPLIIGAIVGLIAFSHLLSWIYKKYRDLTVSLLTGFILGSLGILWPWKKEIYQLDAEGNPLMTKGGEYVIEGYQRYVPDQFSPEVLAAIGLVVAGIVSLWLIEYFAARQKPQNHPSNP